MHQHDRIQHHFNSHPHKEEDGLCASVWFCMLISTHILTKRMTYFPLFCFALNPISTHILTKRMTTHDRLSVPHQSHFNSHPHEEDDKTGVDASTIYNISTHILTKRMTDPAGGSITLYCISTHILTKRMTFISTPFSGGNYISTHILTKRMTY